MIFLVLFAAAAITFGIQHKAPFLHNKFSLLDRMLVCTYCSGFHGGWLSYLLFKWGDLLIREALLFAFASAMFSYSLDEVVKYFERAGSLEE